MSDTSWTLKGVDPEVREQAVEEAARLGVSLSDYLSEKLLRTALLEQAAVHLEADEPDFVPELQQPAQGAGFAPRHRIEAVERRLGLAVGTFDSAVEALDASLVELAARVDETEAVANETSEALVETVQEIGANLNALRKRLADAEEVTEAQGEGFEAADAALDERLQIVDAVARGAEQAALALAEAQEALKHAVVQDFSDFTRVTRAEAEAAAEQTDAAIANLVREVRGARELLEERMAESVAETRMRVQEAFDDSGARLNALSDRLTVNERATGHLRSQLADAEDGAQTALEETADALRQAGAALAAEFARATQDTRASLEGVHADISNEIAEIRDRQAGESARIKLLDAAAASTANEISAIRQLLGSAMGDVGELGAQINDGEAATRSRFAQLHTELDSRFDAITAGEDARQQRADEALAAFRLETERIEACTLAALEQLNANIAAGDGALQTNVDARLHRADQASGERFAALEERLHQTENATDTLIADVAKRLEAQIADLRESHTGATAHLKIIDRTIGSQNFDSLIATAVSPMREHIQRIEDEFRHRPVDRMFATRLDQLEAAASRAETDQALEILKAQVDGIAMHLRALHLDDGAAQRIDDLRTRLTGVEGKSGEAADRVQSVVQLLGRVTQQSADSITQSDERLHKLEMALADLRLDRLAAEPPQMLEAVTDVTRRMADLEERHTRAARADAARPSALEAVAEVAQRMADLEERQAAVLQSLQADIAQFIAESDRRLSSVEERASTGGDAESDNADLAHSFETLRVRVEERILGIELRSVRTLEQVADTVALLEERLMGPHDASEFDEKATG